MSYVDPPTFVAAATLTAADLNVAMDDIRDHEARLNAQAFQGVALSHSAAVSIPDNSDTPISWSSAYLDEGNWWTSGTDVVVPSGALPPGASSVVVEATASVRFAANGAGSRRLQVMVNGAITEGRPIVSALTGDTTEIFWLAWAVVVPTDIITLEVFQNSGGSLNAANMFLHVKRIGVL